VTARSMGFPGIVFEDATKAIGAFHNLLGDLFKRGRNFLNRNAKRPRSKRISRRF
jgi:hypothetical protein